MSQAPASSSCTIPSTNTEYSTVNLSDLQEFFPHISSAIAQEPASSEGSAASSQPSSSFTLQGPQFKVEASLVEDDIPEFPSFSEAQAPGTLDSLNMDDFEDLLNTRLMSVSGNVASILSQTTCQQAPPPSSSNAAQNSAASQNTSDLPGSTWMNYPNSIVNLLQNEGMIDIVSNNNHRPVVLDEYDELMSSDELMSADEDRLISIFNTGSQAGFVSGHPT